VIVGCVTETGEQGTNLARSTVLRAGWPVDVPGVTLKPLLLVGSAGGELRRAWR
jgi:acetyl-CoA acetyltransferase